MARSQNLQLKIEISVIDSASQAISAFNSQLKSLENTVTKLNVSVPRMAGGAKNAARSFDQATRNISSNISRLEQRARFLKGGIFNLRIANIGFDGKYAENIAKLETRYRSLAINVRRLNTSIAQECAALQSAGQVTDTQRARLDKLTQDYNENLAAARRLANGITYLRNEMRKTNAEMAEAHKNLFRDRRNWMDLSMSLIPIGAIITGIGAAITGISLKMTKTALDYDTVVRSTENGFAKLLGSAKKANKLMDDLQEFAILSPFVTKDLLPIARFLMQMGFSADKLLPAMMAIGNAAGSLGGSTATFMNIAMALGKMNIETHVFAMRLNQLHKNGIPAADILAKKLHVTRGELQELVRAGKVPSKWAVEALLDAFLNDRRFKRAMDNAMQTVPGQFSIIAESIVLLLYQGLLPLIQTLLFFLRVVAKVSVWLFKINRWLNNHAKWLKFILSVLFSLATVAAIVFGGMLLAVGALTVGIGTLAMAIAGLAGSMIILKSIQTPADLLAIAVQAKNLVTQIWALIAANTISKLSFKGLAVSLWGVAKAAAVATLNFIRLAIAKAIAEWEITLTVIGVLLLIAALYELSKHLRQISQGLIDFGRSIWNALSDLPARLIRLLTSFFPAIGNFARSMYRSGRALFDTFIQGMRDSRSPLTRAIGEILERLNQFLPHSNAKRGPLARLSQSGRAFIDTFVRGMVERMSLLDRFGNRMGATAVHALAPVLYRAPAVHPYMPGTAGPVVSAGTNIVPFLPGDGMVNARRTPMRLPDLTPKFPRTKAPFIVVPSSLGNGSALTSAIARAQLQRLNADQFNGTLPFAGASGITLYPRANQPSASSYVQSSGMGSMAMGKNIVTNGEISAEQTNDGEWVIRIKSATANSVMRNQMRAAR
ncbi:MAG: tape measure protein [Ignavibacteria bacterium]|nr:tape measure protein [Ignavibacteria bacterium]